MKGMFCSLLAILLIASFSGCATMESGLQSSELEARMNKLETRIQKVEKGQKQIANMVVNQVSLQSKEKAMVIEKEILENPSNKDIQAALKNAGFYTGSIDGKIGPKTREAIMEFQKDSYLKVDGVVGRNTWEILSEHYN
ncbi:peptidoglycan-binding protein [Candidatus Omnitrophota bacterium]